MTHVVPTRAGFASPRISLSQHRAPVELRILLSICGGETCAALGVELEKLGYSTVTAIDDRHALSLLALEHFDVLFLGLSPSLEATRETVLRLRGDVRGATIPIVVVAPPEGGEEIGELLDAGASDFVRPPFTGSLLRARLNACVAQQRLREEHAELKKLEQLSAVFRDQILPLGVSLSTERDVDRLLERILLEAKRFCNADAATLYVRTAKDTLRFQIMLTDSLGIALGGTTGREIPLPDLRLFDDGGAPNHRNVATKVALSGEPVNIPDIYRTADYDFAATKIFDANNGYRSQSTLTVPLKTNSGDVLGVLQLLNALERDTGRVAAFDTFQQLVVESLTSQAAVALHTRLLQQRQEELLKFERDVQIGRQIQAGFLPSTVPQPAGWELAAHFEPAREVAGDFYDVFPIAGGRVGMVIADVCDKGVGAALFMALVRSLMRAFSQQREATHVLQAATRSSGPRRSIEIGAVTVVDSTSLMDAVVLTNNYIGQNHESMNMFATLFYGVLDTATGVLTYVNGGHNPPAIFRRDGRVDRLMPTGPAVGMVDRFAYEVREDVLGPGDVLFTFTDGVTDARNPAGKLFGEKRLLELLATAAAEGSAESLVGTVRDQLRGYIDTAAQYDDITMLVARRAAPD